MQEPPLITSALLSSIGDDPQVQAQFLFDLAQVIKDRAGKLESQLSQSYWPDWDKSERQWKNDFEWRLAGVNAPAASKSIYDKCNMSRNKARAIARFLIAKTDDEMFSTEPWFSATPTGEQAMGDRLGAEEVSRAIEFYQSQEWANFPQSIKEATRAAWARAVGIVKITSEKRIRKYRQFATYMIDPMTERPYLGLDGQPIERDKAKPIYMDMVSGLPVPEGMEPPPGSRFTFEGLPPEVSFGSEAEVPWQNMTEEKVETLYDGPRAKTVLHRNFLFDPTRSHLEDNDLIVEKTSIKVADLKALYGAGMIPPGQLDQLLSSARPLDPSTQPAQQGLPGVHVPAGITTTTESGTWSNTPISDFLPVWECYIDAEVPELVGGQPPGLDPMGRPITVVRRLWALFAPGTDEIIFSDYLGNVSPYGQLCHRLITTSRFDGQLVGDGIFKTYEPEQDCIDRNYSHINYRNRFASNPFRVINKEAFDETAGTKPLEITPDGQLTKRGQLKDKPASELIEFVVMPALEENSFRLMEMTEKQIENDSGVSPVTSGDFSELPQNAPASGIKSILSSSSVFVKTGIREIIRGVEGCLELFADWIFWRRTTPLDYEFDDDEDIRQFGTLPPEVVRDMRVKVRLAMTRFGKQEELASAKEALSTISTALPDAPFEVRLLLVGEILKILGTANADQIIMKMQIANQQAMMPAGTPGAAPPPGGAPAPPPEAPAAPEPPPMA